MNFSETITTVFFENFTSIVNELIEAGVDFKKEVDVTEFGEIYTIHIF